MLDVHRRVYVDARLQQLHHVLPPLGVPAAGRVGVRQLVDQDQRGTAGERGVEIELLYRRPAILDAPPGQELQLLEQRLGLGAAVQLDVADDDVDAVVVLLARRLQHRVGLADTGRRAEEDLQLAAPRARFFFLHAREQRLGIGPLVRHDP